MRIWMRLIWRITRDWRLWCRVFRRSWLRGCWPLANCSCWGGWQRVRSSCKPVLSAVSITHVCGHSTTRSCIIWRRLRILLSKLLKTGYLPKMRTLQKLTKQSWNKIKRWSCNKHSKKRVKLWKSWPVHYLKLLNMLDSSIQSIKCTNWLDLWIWWVSSWLRSQWVSWKVSYSIVSCAPCADLTTLRKRLYPLRSCWMVPIC